jgi:glycosyltransferase 2 family protein
MAASLGLIPLGLGTFEATCVAMLRTFGVSLEAALTVTLLLRGFMLWLPMLPGLWLARRELSRKPRKRRFQAKKQNRQKKG